MLISHETGECCGFDGGSATVGKQVGSRRPCHVSTSGLMVFLVLFTLFAPTTAAPTTSAPTITPATRALECGALAALYPISRHTGEVTPNETAHQNG